MPEIEIEFVDSDEGPVGLGEAATTVIALAIANAIEEAIGIRISNLPITPDAILAAMNDLLDLLNRVRRRCEDKGIRPVDAASSNRQPFACMVKRCAPLICQI